MKKLALILSLFTFTLFLSSCRKEKNTTAEITVVNSAQVSVPGVEVRVYCPSSTCNQGAINSEMDRNATSDGSGKVKFDYTEQYRLGQSGFAVLDVAIYPTGTTDFDGTTPIATGVVKIEEEKENTQTITCQGC